TLYATFQRNVIQKQNKLQNLMQSDLGEVVGKDKELIDNVSQMLTQLPADQAQFSLDGLMEAERVSTPLKQEATIIAQNTAKGPVNPASLSTVNKAVNYVKLWGDNTG